MVENKQYPRRQRKRFLPPLSRLVSEDCTAPTQTCKQHSICWSNLTLINHKSKFQKPSGKIQEDDYLNILLTPQFYQVNIAT